MTSPKWGPAQQAALEKAWERSAREADEPPRRRPPDLSAETLARAAELLEEQRAKSRKQAQARRARKRAARTNEAGAGQPEERSRQ